MNYTAQVKNGKVELFNPSVFYQNLQKLEGSKVNICVDKVIEKPRRLKLMGYHYHGIVVKTIHKKMVEMGCTVVDGNGKTKPLTIDDVHNYLKQRFNGRRIIQENQVASIPFGGSTKSLSEEEFMAYVDRVIAWAESALKITIPRVTLEVPTYGTNG